MGRADEFIRLYNQVSEHLAKITGADRTASFSWLVDNAAKTDATVRRNRSELKAYGDLRNAIIHYRDYPPKVIAEPTEDAVRQFERLISEISSPERLIPTFQKEIRCLLPRDSLVAALRYMRECDFSQVVVRHDGMLNLLTAEGVARWFEERLEEDIISVAESRVGEVLPLEIQGSFVVMRRQDTVSDALEAFGRSLEEGRPRLYAIIITQNGKRSEEPLGIVTPWDLLGPKDA